MWDLQEFLKSSEFAKDSSWPNCLSYALKLNSGPSLFFYLVSKHKIFLKDNAV